MRTNLEGRAVGRRGRVGRWGWAASGAARDGCGSLARRAMAAATVAAVASCSPMESEEARGVSYAKNVESCLCRSFEFQTDSYSGLTYEHMLERCNQTVHAANPQRYPESANAAPAIDTLRCPTSVAEWREIVP